MEECIYGMQRRQEEGWKERILGSIGLFLAMLILLWDIKPWQKPENEIGNAYSGNLKEKRI